MSQNKTKRPDPGAVTVVVECLIKYETEKALLVANIGGRDKQNWIAKSQLKKETVPSEEGAEFTIFVPTWIANANGWQYDEYVPEDWPEETKEEWLYPPQPMANRPLPHEGARGEPVPFEDDEFDDDIPF